MAATVALASSSLHFLKYKITADGAGAVNLDAAGAATPDLLTDAKAGSELKTILATVCANAAATRAVLERADIEAYLLPCDVDANWFLTPDANANKIRLTFTAAAIDAGSYFVIGHRHTNVQ